MKIARLVFMIVLLASVVFVPGQTASAYADVSVDIQVGDPIAAPNGMVTYPFTVIYGVTPTRTAPVDAIVTVSFERAYAIDSIAITGANGATITVNNATKVIRIEEWLAVGSLAEQVTFTVTYNVAGSLPPSALPLPVRATAVIQDRPGSLPSAMDFVDFNLGAPGAVISITADQTTVSVGLPVTFTVTFNTTAFTFTPVDAVVSVTFAPESQVLRVKNATGGAVITDKTVTWTGTISPGSLDQSFSFTVVYGSTSVDANNKPTASTNVATASIADVNQPGSLPAVSDSETITVLPGKQILGIISRQW